MFIIQIYLFYGKTKINNLLSCDGHWNVPVNSPHHHAAYKCQSNLDQFATRCCPSIVAAFDRQLCVQRRPPAPIALPVFGARFSLLLQNSCGLVSRDLETGCMETVCAKQSVHCCSEITIFRCGRTLSYTMWIVSSPGNKSVVCTIQLLTKSWNTSRVTKLIMHQDRLLVDSQNDGHISTRFTTHTFPNTCATFCSTCVQVVSTLIDVDQSLMDLEIGQPLFIQPLFVRLSPNNDIQMESQHPYQ